MSATTITLGLIKRREQMREFLGVETYNRHSEVAVETIATAMKRAGETNPINAAIDLAQASKAAGHELASQMFLCGALDLIEEMPATPHPE